MDKPFSPDKFPDDWWRSPGGLVGLMENYQRSHLGLFVSIRDGIGYKNILFSGVPILFKDYLLWVTAGHAICELDNILSYHSGRIAVMFWFDFFGDDQPDAGAFTVHNRALKRVKSFDPQVDLGFVVLEDLDAWALSENPYGKVFRITEKVETRSIDTIGYHLVGYPDEFNKFTSEPVSDTKVRNVYESTLVCQPLVRATKPHSTTNDDFWDYPDAFYGQLVSVTDNGPMLPASIKGMSGGPIFAIGQPKQDGYPQQLIAIQSSWLPQSRYIRAATMTQVHSFVTKALAE